MSISILFGKIKSIFLPFLCKVWQNTSPPLLLTVLILILLSLAWVLPSKLTVVAQTLALIVAIWTLNSHRRVSAAQLFRNRYDTFFDSWAVEDEDVRQFKEKPHLFVENMDSATYEGYRKDDNAIRNFLLIVQLYEYLAFAHALNTSSKYLGKSLPGRFWDWTRIGKWWNRWGIVEWWSKVRKELEPEASDPYGKQWIDRWVKLLIDDPNFLDVHKAYKDDHPEFHRYLETRPEFCRRYGEARESYLAGEIYQVERWIFRDIRWSGTAVQIDWTSEARSIKKQELLELLRKREEEVRQGNAGVD